MDPLSSLHFAVTPEMRAARLPKAGEGGALRAIPSSELEKLGGATGPELQQTGAVNPSSFEGALGNLVAQVNDRQVAANQAVTGILSGQDVSLHQTMIAMEEANVSFQLMVEVRNKLLESYQELMRMQI